jgi:hypothetical protein
MAHRHPAALTAVIVPAVALAVLGSASPARAQMTLLNHSVKFVCGTQLPTPNLPGEPTVKPGNYATEINIHNIQFSQTRVIKSVVLVVDRGQPVGREPEAQAPRGFVAVTMGARFAMMDDCNKLWDMAFPGGAPPPNPMPLIIGYLSILSPVEIDVDAVYTTQAFRPTAADAPDAPGIDVEHIAGKRVSTAATSPEVLALRKP